jgi:hypothetical protein
VSNKIPQGSDGAAAKQQFKLLNQVSNYEARTAEDGNLIPAIILGLICPQIELKPSLSTTRNRNTRISATGST